MDLLGPFLETCGRLPREGGLAGVVVGLSGGPDSMVLLDLYLRSGMRRERLVAAHLDHGIRAGSDRDLAFSRERARAAGVPFRSARVAVPALAERSGTGLEAAGRRARYSFLHRVAREEGLGCVATGHHRDDQVETVLLRVLRGCGARGLRGVHAARPIEPGSDVLLLRPLLFAGRREIRSHLAAGGIPFVRDPTNRDGSNLRSRVRVGVLPLLEAGVPHLAERLLSLARRAEALSGRRPATRGPAIGSTTA